MLHFALRNRKLVFGLSVTLVMFFLLLASSVPSSHYHAPLDTAAISPGRRPPWDGYCLGTTPARPGRLRPIRTGLRLAFIVGADRRRIAAASARGRLHGRLSQRHRRRGPEHAHECRPRASRPSRAARHRRLPERRGIMTESLFIGSRPGRGQHAPCRARLLASSREFVSLARLSGKQQLADHLQGDRAECELAICS